MYLTRAHRIEPGLTWMVDDIAIDIAAARAVRVRAPACPWGNGNAAQAEPDEIVTCDEDYAFLVCASGEVLGGGLAHPIFASAEELAPSLRRTRRSDACRSEAAFALALTQRRRGGR
jgi:hypothetical protein